MRLSYMYYRNSFTSMKAFFCSETSVVLGDRWWIATFVAIFSCFWIWAPEGPLIYRSWWRHQMETFSALLAICAGNSPVPGEFPTQRLVTRSFDVFFDRRLNKRLIKQSWGWWLETLSSPLWRHRNDGLVQDCSNSIANSLELLQSCT